MKKFKKFYIEITNVCNLACSFCPPTGRQPRFMTQDEFVRVLEKIEGFTDYIYLHVKGEPLLHPDLGDFLEISGEHGLKVNITTNGTLLEERLSDLIHKPALRLISVSLQSMESQDEAQRVAYFDSVMRAVRILLDQTRVLVELRLWNLDKEAVVDGLRQNDDFLERIRKALGIHAVLEEKANKSKGIKIHDRVYLSQSYQFDWPSLDREQVNEVGFCYGLRNQVAVLVDGTVVPCCLDSEGDLSLGSIFEQDTFLEILESALAREIIDGFSNRKAVATLCQKCGYRERFDQ